MSRRKRGIRIKKYFPEQPQDTNLANPDIKKPITKEDIKASLKDIDDIVLKEVKIKEKQVTIIFLSSLIDDVTLQQMVFNPIDWSNSDKPEEIFKHYEVLEQDELPKLIHDVMSGYTVLMFENEIIKLSTFSAPSRSVSPPENETTVMGPQDSFVESLKINLSLIKRRIRSPQLKTKTILLGTETKNTVAVIYMENIANEQHIDKVIKRIENVEFHGFMGLAMLKQMLEDRPFSPFPQYGLTVRTDNATQDLLNGKVLVMMDGSPEAANMPSTFMEMFLSPEDYYNRWTTASLLRALRLSGFFLSILLTSTYVSVLTFHPEMLPPQLLRLLAESRSQVPFPPVIEVLIIELVIEVLREAGARMPTKIGQTIGIVGGIVIGTAAVEAGLASNILIVLVATTALLSFIPPSYLMSNAIRFIRYGYIISAGMLGMFGQMIVFAWMINHLSNLTSLGVPYISPVIPRKWTDLLNSVIRFPTKMVIQRPGISRAKKDLVRPLDEE